MPRPAQICTIALPRFANLRHSREGGNPYWLALRLYRRRQRIWIPACAGMTDVLNETGGKACRRPARQIIRRRRG
ncbi:MAG: hypothetical protein EOP67_27890 [Sphingomonas sp.]|nr:MAG: hypothetical protein EOP67_27890 [Sphingomonas sp.]